MFACFLNTLCSCTNVMSILLFSVIAYLSWKFFQGRNLPPGPWGLPLVGYLPFMGTKPMEETFNNFSKKYGNVMSVYFGSKLFIVLNNFDAIKEAFVKQGTNFSGRPHDLSAFEDSFKGIMGSVGEIWKEHRRFILSTFRDYGMGKLSLEPRITEEVHFYLEEIANLKGKPIDVSDLLAMSTQNIISTLEFGKRFDYKDETFVRLRKLQTDFFAVFPMLPLNSFFPWIDYLPLSESITHQKALNKCLDAIMEFIADLAEEHKADYQEDSRKDLVDAYITEQKRMIQIRGDEGSFNAGEINPTLFQLFSAGADTTASTLRWAYVLMMIHPDMQKKVHDEIDRVIGMERNPSINDKNQMPYTEAVILETLRYSSMTPLNLPHSNIEDAEISGYRIPKGSIILTNLWAVHFDPGLWEQPELFKPERFISADGKTRTPEYLVPFGIGKRSCLGDVLARMELFLYFTGTMQRFDLQPPPGTEPKLEIENKVGRRPKPYEFCAIQRKGYSV